MKKKKERKKHVCPVGKIQGGTKLSLGKINTLTYCLVTPGQGPELLQSHWYLQGVP